MLSHLTFPTDSYPLFPTNSLASGDSGDSFFRGVNLTATGRRKAADAGSALCSLNLHAIYTWDLDDSRSSGSALMAWTDRAQVLYK